MASSDAHLDILSAHYNETFLLVKAAVEKRDRLFLYILGVIFLLLLYMNAPTAVSDWINLYINNNTGPNTNPPKLIEASFVGAILLLALSSFTHTYFQTVLHIERQYDYVYQLENQLSWHFNGQSFIREGEHYRKYKRRFSRWTKWVFWGLFPFLYFVFLAVWLVFLYMKSQATVGYKIVDTLIIVSILISIGLYLLAIFKKQ